MTDDGSDWLEPDPASQPESRDDSAGRMARGPWFVRFAGRRSGPFDVERLRTMARRKALTRMHAVSVDGTTWASAVTLRAVFNPDGSIVSGPALAVVLRGSIFGAGMQPRPAWHEPCMCAFMYTRLCTYLVRNIWF